MSCTAVSTWTSGNAATPTLMVTGMPTLVLEDVGLDLRADALGQETRVAKLHTPANQGDSSPP